MSGWFWVIGLLAAAYIMYKISEWLNEEDSPRREELHSIVVSYNSKDITLPDFDKILKEINNRIVTSYKKSARYINKPIKVKDVVSISTITSERTIQFVIWYKDKSIRKKKVKPYNPYAFGNKYQNRNYRL